MSFNRSLKQIATLGPIGYLKGSGTWASFFGLALFILINFFLNSLSSLILILISTSLALKLLKIVISQFDNYDPQEVVIDEVIGVFYAFWGLRLSIGVIFWGFVFFRFFDITKIIGINYLEKNISSPLSILIDDIVAGLLANFIMRVIG